MGRDASPDDPAAERRDGDETGVEWVGAGRPRGQDQVERIGPPDEGGHRSLDRPGVVVHVVDGDDLRAEPHDLGPDAGLEPVASGRPNRLLDDDPDPPRQERGDPDEWMAAETGQPGAGIHRRSIHEVRRDLDAPDQIAGLDDLAIERGEDLERIDAVEPLEIGDPDVEHARSRGQQVDPTLDRAVHGQPGTCHGGRETDGGVVLVQLARFGDEDGDRLPSRGSRQRRQVVRGQPPSLRPALTRDRQVTGQDRTDEACRGALARRDALDLHGRTAGWSAQPSEGGLDRAARVDGRHRGAIGTVGVDV
jgi:hypothetical protein